MDFKEFVNKLEQDLKDFLSDTSPGAQVRQTPVEKLQAGSYGSYSAYRKQGCIHCSKQTGYGLYSNHDIISDISTPNSKSYVAYNREHG